MLRAIRTRTVQVIIIKQISYYSVLILHPISENESFQKRIGYVLSIKRFNWNDFETHQIFDYMWTHGVFSKRFKCRSELAISVQEWSLDHWMICSKVFCRSKIQDGHLTGRRSLLYKVGITLKCRMFLTSTISGTNINDAI